MRELMPSFLKVLRRREATVHELGGDLAVLRLATVAVVVVVAGLAGLRRRDVPVA